MRVSVISLRRLIANDRRGSRVDVLLVVLGKDRSLNDALVLDQLLILMQNEMYWC